MQQFSHTGSELKEDALKPLAILIPEAERISGYSRTSLYRANARGDLIFVKAGSKTLVDYDSLKTLIQALPRFVGKTGLAA